MRPRHLQKSANAEGFLIMWIIKNDIEAVKGG